MAAVALNLPLRRTFDYRLPAGEDARLEPGCRVVVPFGSRLRSGIVVALKTEADVAEARLRTIARTTSATPLLGSELLSFTRWVADYYLCGWGEVLEAALPTGLGVRFRSVYHWRRAPTEAQLAGLSDSARALVAGAESWDEQAWTKAAAGPGDHAWLRRHSRADGPVAVHTEYVGTRRKPPRERWVALAGELPAPQARRNPKRETRKQRLVRLLREEGEAPMGRLRAVLSSPAQVVRELAADGVVTVSERPQRPEPFGGEVAPEPFLALNTEQQAAANALGEALRTDSYAAFLLEGVTGSGKTEVYLHAVREAVAQERGCLILVPEIALTAAMVNRFRARFGRRVAVLHSGMGEGDRFNEWSRIRDGEATIVIGARSAVFAPVEHLGLVVVDEEHDTSYKQDEAPRYNGRDAALVRAHRAGAVAVLGSATPSMESLRNVALGKLARLHLPGRVAERPMPGVRLLDLRTERRQTGSTFFTVTLLDALRETLKRGEQGLLFLNRRGFASLVRGTQSKEPLLCEHCSITLTWHQSEGLLRCHRCDYTAPMPAAHPETGEPLQVVGIGTQRIEEEIATIFPEARVLRMDSDSLRRRGELERMMEGIREHRYDIIIGTQVLSKGHDFPHITLVGAVLADVSLNLPDFRSPERTFQILTQMAGRAGRGDRPGQVLIQTYSPQHYALAHVEGHDTASFAETELAIRAEAGAPPFSSQALLWVSAPEPAPAEALAERLAERLRAEAPEGVRVLGAAEAPIRRLHGRHRYMVLLRGPSVRPLHSALRRVLDAPDLQPAAQERIAVDVDPYNLL